MKKLLYLLIILACCSPAIGQSTDSYSTDVDKVYGLIKNGAFKRGYNYMITFKDANQGAIFVTPNTSYLVFFVYDNTNHPVTNFRALLMTPDKVLQKKYTAQPYDRGQLGVARVEQLQVRTPAFTGDTRPVKFEADPKATIYVFNKK